MVEGRLWRARKQRIDKIHQWRPRRSRAGELVQWDTSEHAWLEDRGPKLYLISMIDDASSRIHAPFVLHDSTEENMRLVWSYVELHGRPGGDQTGQQRLFDSGGSPNLADRTRQHSGGLARSRRASRGSARRVNGSAVPGVIPGGEPMPATSQSANPQRNRKPRAEACPATREKPMDGELPLDRPRKNRSGRKRGITSASRPKTNSAGRAGTAPPASRLLYSKPPLKSLTKVILPAKAKPPEGTRRARLTEGLPRFTSEPTPSPRL
jgi:hypothetical protein